MTLLAGAAAALGAATLLWALSREPARAGRLAATVAAASGAVVVVVAVAGAGATSWVESEPGLPHPAFSGAPPGRGAVTSVVASAASITALGCGQVAQGSGFVVSQGLVVTNAHVVAGADTVIITRPGEGQFPASVVYFDPRNDVALLEAPELSARPVTFGDAAAGQPVVVVGNPTDPEPDAVAATVRERIVAISPDIYGETDVSREVLVLTAPLEAGRSGSAVADADGRVVGMAFAVDATDSDTAYALPVSALRAAVAGTSGATVGTGSCPLP